MVESEGLLVSHGINVTLLTVECHLSKVIQTTFTLYNSLL